MTTMNERKIQALKNWMDERDITIRAVAERLAMTPSATSALLRRPTMPTKRFNALRNLGFPAEILPIPLDQKSGRPPKIPRFPAEQETAE